MKIILTGYMGSGKSTIAVFLAQKLQIPFQDLDQIIENETQMSIKTIFESKGEIYFRKLEHTTLRRLMASQESFVLSLGGGTPCYANNHEFLNGAGVVSFYLKVPIETLANRLSHEKASRPIIANQDAQRLKEFIGQHLFERSYYYQQATHTIAANEKSPEEIVAEIELVLI
jgi:shikimate kinase